MNEKIIYDLGIGLVTSVASALIIEIVKKTYLDSIKIKIGKIPFYIIILAFFIGYYGSNKYGKTEFLGKSKTVNEKTSIAPSVQEKSVNKNIPQQYEQISTEIPENIEGVHNLTLQWISWDHPGKINFIKVGENEFNIDGYQEYSGCQNCYLKVNGHIIRLSPTILQFTGIIETSVFYINQGQPCYKEGTFNFVAKGSRKYWRCQNMNGCDGVTDYVDIYF